MKLVTWNVNGLRACMDKGFGEFFAAEDADLFALQETKLQPDQIDFCPEGYRCFWNSAEKKGYSGTAVFSRKEPEDISYGPGDGMPDAEGRVITMTFDDFIFVTVYTPNSQRDLKRLDYRMEWEENFRAYLKGLDRRKPVIICGDLNVAHREIDLKNPSSNHRNAGFTDEERGKMTELLDSGFTDCFRALYPDRAEAYSWWSYMFKSRERNAGWRIDYFLCSDRLMPEVKDCVIRSDVLGSDHCPVELILK